MLLIHTLTLVIRAALSTLFLHLFNKLQYVTWVFCDWVFAMRLALTIARSVNPVTSLRLHMEHSQR